MERLREEIPWIDPFHSFLQLLRLYLLRHSGRSLYTVLVKEQAGWQVLEGAMKQQALRMAR
jgi:hypothetical protein